MDGARSAAGAADVVVEAIEGFACTSETTSFPTLRTAPREWAPICGVATRARLRALAAALSCLSILRTLDASCSSFCRRRCLSRTSASRAVRSCRVRVAPSSDSDCCCFCGGDPASPRSSLSISSQRSCASLPSYEGAFQRTGKGFIVGIGASLASAAVFSAALLAFSRSRSTPWRRSRRRHAPPLAQSHLSRSLHPRVLDEHGPPMHAVEALWRHVGCRCEDAGRGSGRGRLRAASRLRFLGSMVEDSGRLSHGQDSSQQPEPDLLC
jgi:hypothetical protein